MKILSFIVVAAILLANASLISAQTAKPPSFGISAMMSRGDDTKEINSELTFNDDKLVVTSDKKDLLRKEFAYADIKAVDYSYSKKPMWKTGVVSAIFLGPFAAPFFFIRKKSHWMTIRTADDFVVMKLEYKNYKKIIGEFEGRSIAVEMLKDK